ncbi:MAG: hypothetical protein GYA36_18195 [Veillonellaceae bacterium]|nr:hypothetical protein [Veillonellaceae bacterium]
MKSRIIACLVLFIAFLVVGASAGSTDAQLVVTEYSVSPTSLISGDIGTVTVTVKNTGDESVSIHSADLESPCEGFKILNTAAYDTVGTLGSGDSTTFTFTFEADVLDGTYYPKFYLDLTDGGSYRMYIPVNVKSTGLTVAVSKLPDSFNDGVKSRINLSVGNPRESEINGVRIIPVADGATITPGTGFIGTLAADASREVTFEITPSEETTVTFMVTYHNGINDHVQNITLPIRFSEDKLGADIVLNNVEIEGGSYTTISGDINNAGLTSAYSVTVTVGKPMTAVDPNQIYVIGELEPDDFASFEVTYTGTGSTVPVVVSYKDADGNTFTRTFETSTRASGGTSLAPGSSSGRSSSGFSGAPGGSRGGGMPFFGMRGVSGSAGSLPLMEIGIGLVVVLVIGIIAWKKGYIRKLKEKIPRRKQSEDDDDPADR